MLKRTGFKSVVPDGWPVLPKVASERKRLVVTDPNVLVCGRNTLVWRSPDQGFFYKLYYGRGRVSWLREHLFGFKVEREFCSLSFLESENIPCSAPVFWSKFSHDEYSSRCELLVTREVPLAVSLDVYLTQDTPFANKLELAEKVGRLLSRMHEKGFYHGALYTRNLLVSVCDGEPAPVLIDVDMSVVFNRPINFSLLARFDLFCLLSQAVRSYNSDLWIRTVLRTYGYCDKESATLAKKVRSYQIKTFKKDLYRTLSRFKMVI